MPVSLAGGRTSTAVVGAPVAASPAEAGVPEAIPAPSQMLVSPPAGTGTTVLGAPASLSGMPSVGVLPGSCSPSPVGREASALPVDAGGTAGSDRSGPTPEGPLPPVSPRLAGRLAAPPPPQNLDCGVATASGDVAMVDGPVLGGVADSGGVATDASDADESEEEMPLDRFERFQASLQRDASGQLVVCPPGAMDTAADGGAGDGVADVGRGGGAGDLTAVGRVDVPAVGGVASRLREGPGGGGLDGIASSGGPPTGSVSGRVLPVVGDGGEVGGVAAAAAAAAAGAAETATSAAAAAAFLASPGSGDPAARSPTPDASSSGSPVEVRRSSVPARRKRRLPSLALNGCSSSDDDPAERPARHLVALRCVAAAARAVVAAACDATAADGIVASAGVGAVDADRKSVV